MDALAPVSLALSVSLDAVATLSLVLMSYQGPLAAALFPRTDDTHLNIAAGVGDILLLALLRGSVVMLPLLGLAATRVWLAAAVLAVTAMTGWLGTKAALLWQLCGGLGGAHTLVVGHTGVEVAVPLLLAAEALGAFMGWLLLALVVANRRVMRQPAAGAPFIALQTRTAAAMRQQRLSVQRWLATGGAAAGAGGLEAPLLAPGQVGGEIEDGAASFVSAHSRQVSAADSWASAASLTADGGAAGQ